MIHRSFAAILSSIADLLDSHEGPHRAFVREHIYTVDEAVLNAWEIWGGEGSVSDFSPTDPAVNRALMELLVELEDGMGAMGLSSPRARQIAQLMEDWLITYPQGSEGGTRGGAYFSS
jgi:hypothetical protein